MQDVPSASFAKTKSIQSQYMRGKVIYSWRGAGVHLIDHTAAFRFLLAWLVVYHAQSKSRLVYTDTWSMTCPESCAHNCCRMKATWGFDDASLKPSESIYKRVHLLREYRTSTMDSPPHALAAEMGSRKPRTLVLCFDGTSNEFRHHVRQTAHFSGIFNLTS